MHGMEELSAIMSNRPLRIRAFRSDMQTATNKKTIARKTLHCVRHGQGFHNLLADQANASGIQWQQFVVSPNNPYTKPEILDAPLTEKGRQQALALRTPLVSLQPQLAVVSPNCRTLQTCVLATAALASIPLMAHEDCREECGVHLCDRRRSAALQAAEFPQVDFSLLDHDEDPLFNPDQRETKVQVGERVYRFMEWLEGRPEDNVVVFSHSGWLLTMFNGVVDCGGDASLLDWWQTGELRSVVLEFVRD